ncbi:SH3 domain-binding protein 5-like [Oncorhynchus kisutch]|uniref:SH3 domain-binding protein 5 n=1 Tax=Oncorhynchus kisutch TaxID=8019 RepID=A0A8C7GKD5_ONCKI|nr:SH3 domain-binding protein 5-like [Oncorhynchus kisutch]XP_031642544.1 SH3 domain-binding protein 5-like [Oncorhynchus kisutch]
MEPGDLRVSPAGSGDPEVGELREETPGADAEVKGGEPNDKEMNGDTAETVLKEKDTCEGEECTEKEKNEGELHSPYEEELDPRIQEELEHLNEASVKINQLELHLDDARSGYRKILTDSARKLNTHSSQLGTCIEKARPYYEARRLAKEAQQETQKAALSYERAVSMHTAAREMVYVAEQGLMADGRNTLDPTWQEMLNHATSKVNEAEEERLRSEREHMRVTHSCQTAEARVQTLQKSLKRAIVKSKPYFELKSQFNYILEEHKTKVMQLEEHVTKVKNRYSVALHNLEQISEAIHAQRGRDQTDGGQTMACGGRSPPIGAESDSVVCGVEGGACGGGSMETDRVNRSGVADKKNGLVEKYRESGGERPETHGERAGSDSLSVFSLQTIASDLEKCDSIEHLGEFSDVGSLPGEDGENERGGGRERREGQMQRQQQFLKQHHRSFSL